MGPRLYSTSLKMRTSIKWLTASLMLPLLISMVGSPYARAMEMQEPDSNMSTEQSRVYQALIDTVSVTEEDDWYIRYSDNVSAIINTRHQLGSRLITSDGIGIIPSEFAALAHGGDPTGMDD